MPGGQLSIFMAVGRFYCEKTAFYGAQFRYAGGAVRGTELVTSDAEASKIAEPLLCTTKALPLSTCRGVSVRLLVLLA